MAYIHVYSTRINWENEPSITSPINATNLNKMDYALKAMDDTFGNWDISKANESDLLLALKDVSYDTDTGVFVFTWFNGTTSTIDLNIEKIPVSFSMDANGVITMTTEDGTTYTADVGALIKTYTFNDSSVIDFTVTTDASGNKTVTADIVSGSIDGTKLTPNYLADCTQAKTGAETAATNSEASSQDAEAWAVGTRGGVPVPSTDPAYENNAEYWANHTSSSLAGLTDTDINNPSDGEVLKYNGTTSKWENGQAAAGGGSTIVVTTSESALYGQNVTITDGVTTLTQTFDNTGLATFSGVTMTGNLTIACLTASTSLNVPYFGNYTAVVSSFSASITVTYPGGTCTCVGNGESYTSSSSPYTFTVHGAATYTITNTIDGVSKTETVTITTDGQSESVTISFGTINVTYDNDFRGTSITCTQGGTTITKTAPAGGNTMVFYPPTTGSWTISGTVGGILFSTSATVSSLSTPVSVNLKTNITKTVTVYGAAGAIISFTDATGSKTVTLNNSGQGSTTITFAPPSQSITFTDTNVAKNPDDLSQNYSKSIAITESTTSIKVMPDNALYWYGYMDDNSQELSVANGWTTITGYSFTSPTYNTNDITLTGATKTVKGIGSKNAVSMTKAHIISQCTKVSAGFGLYVLGSLTTKNVSGGNEINQATLNTIQHLSANVSGTYISAEVIDGRDGVIYALWYE